MAEGPPGTRQINTGPWLYTNRGIKFCKKISGTFWGYMSLRTTYFTFWDKKNLKFEFFQFLPQNSKPISKFFSSHRWRCSRANQQKNPHVKNTIFRATVTIFSSVSLNKKQSIFPSKNSSIFDFERVVTSL